MTEFAESRLITEIDVREYFRESVTTAATNQHIDINTETILYIVNMLTSFLRSENFYEKTEDGYMIRALALIYADCVDAATTTEKNLLLQRLGDIALFISGVFSYSLNRSPVDVDYYAALGGIAYANLAESARNGYRSQTHSMVFAELSDKFLSLVDVLAEVNDKNAHSSDSDIMRLYELWLKTGSQRIAKILQRNGIQPVHISGLAQ